ncbi:unnamed protein product [Pieris macdunnoughi]|uniref:Protein Wnt n=1 Tax=Pieris macdunnoughi TaxID=345717 RepID=A0A821T7S4_9NEOP|nr:unnamed protein product [Pieris macdunnoughi]
MSPNWGRGNSAKKTSMIDPGQFSKFYPSFLRLCNNASLPGFRETSFLYALTAAGVAHAIARACAQGRLLSCGCDQLGYRASHDPRGRGRNKWEWSGCSHNLAYGIDFSKKFLDVRDQVDDLQSKINVHNNNAGRLNGTLGTFLSFKKMTALEKEFAFV